MAESITVKPSPEYVASNQVALWDQDRAHWAIDEKWRVNGGAWIAGDESNPDATYVVADTPEVRQAINARRLIVVDGKVAALDKPVDHTTDETGKETSVKTGMPTEAEVKANDALTVKNESDQAVTDAPKKGK